MGGRKHRREEAIGSNSTLPILGVFAVLLQLDQAAAPCCLREHVDLSFGRKDRDGLMDGGSTPRRTVEALCEGLNPFLTCPTQTGLSAFRP